MKSKKKVLSMLLSLVMLAALMTGCGGADAQKSDGSNGGGDTTPKADTYEITMTSFDNAPTVACQLGTKFADLVSEKSDGRIKINFHTDATLGNETEQYDLIKTGEIQICYFADSFGSQIASGYDPSIIPFLFTSIEDVEAIFDSELGESIKKAAYENGNVRLLGLSRRSPRLLTASKEITSAEGLKGLKLRVPEIQAWVTVWNSMGANCMVVSWSETYSALQTGVVDGQENPIDNIYANKIYEVNKFIMQTEHLQSVNHWCVNADFWDSMSVADQEILTSCFQEAADWANGALSELNGQYLEEILADGTVQYVTVDKSAFQEAASSGIEAVKKTLQPEAQEYIEQYLAS